MTGDENRLKHGHGSSGKASCSPPEEGKRPLRWGFSTGTAMTAAARAAYRVWLTGEKPVCVDVRLPAGSYLPVPIREAGSEEEGGWASVIKDGGDDPDVTHKAEVRVTVTALPREMKIAEGRSVTLKCGGAGSILLVAGRGVGLVTKAGLPVRVGEPAINPTPREMLCCNLIEEAGGSLDSDLLVEVSIPRGEELARYTLNPRLGIVGGISILGTTGLVKPFSHKAYEETIQVALSVAASNGCREVVLTTGGKSEKLAQAVLSHLPAEAFVQVADFFAFSVEEASRAGFAAITHAVFFGKAVKMAQGHRYTHAHRIPLDLAPLARSAREQGQDEAFCKALGSANTARQALELLLERGAHGVIREVGREALKQSRRLAGEGIISLRLLLFDFDGSLLVDVSDGAGAL